MLYCWVRCINKGTVSRYELFKHINTDFNQYRTSFLSVRRWVLGFCDRLDWNGIFALSSTSSSAYSFMSWDYSFKCFKHTVVRIHVSSSVLVEFSVFCVIGIHPPAYVAWLLNSRIGSWNQFLASKRDLSFRLWVQFLSERRQGQTRGLTHACLAWLKLMTVFCVHSVLER